MTAPEKVHPEYTDYVDDACKSNYVVDESDLKLYKTSASLAEKTMTMRSTFTEKDEFSRRKAQGYQTWIKGQRKS